MRRSAAFLLMLLLPLAVEAQLTTRNKTQVGIGGFGWVSDGSTSLSGQLSITKFFTNALEIGAAVQATATGTSTGGGDDVFGDGGGGGTELSVSGYVFGQAKLNFVGQGLTVPYLTVGAGAPIQADVSSLTFQYGGGIKRFLSENVSINGEAVALGMATDYGFEAAQSILLNFGISVYFNRK
jgi:hypothetical protein